MRLMRSFKPFRLGWIILHLVTIGGTLVLGNLPGNYSKSCRRKRGSRFVDKVSR